MRSISSLTLRIAVVVISIKVVCAALDVHTQNSMISPICRDRHGNVHHQLLSEITMALDVALKYSSLFSDMLKYKTTVIQKCTDVHESLLEVWTSDDEKHVKEAKVVLLEVNAMYHEDGNRNSDEFYDIFGQIFPVVLTSLSKEEYKECFHTFSELQGMFENYREDMQQEISLENEAEKDNIKEKDDRHGREDTTGSVSTSATGICSFHTQTCTHKPAWLGVM